MVNIIVEKELDKIVNEKIKRAPYLEPTPSISDEEYRKQRDDLKTERISRPSTKIEYLELLNSLEAQIKEVSLQNTQIGLNNTAARKAIDDQYSADISAAKLNVDNQWAAVRLVRNNMLKETDWTQLSDVQLTEDEKINIKTYRQALRDITTQSDPTNIVFPIYPLNK